MFETSSYVSWSEWTVVSSSRSGRRRRGWSVSESSWSEVGLGARAADEGSWTDVASVASAATAASAASATSAAAGGSGVRPVGGPAVRSVVPASPGESEDSDVWSEGCYVEAWDRQRVASHFDEESRYFGFSGRRVWATLEKSRESPRLTVSVEGELAPGDMTAFDLLGRSGGRSVSVWERVAADRSGHGRGHTSWSYSPWGVMRRGESASPFFVDPCWRTESALRSVAGRAPTVSVRREKERVEFSLPVVGSVVFRQSKVAERRAKGFDASRVFELQSAADAGSIRVRPLGAYEDSREVLKRVGAGACELIAGKASAPKGHCKAGRVRHAVGLGGAGGRDFFRPDASALSRRQCLEVDLGRLCVVRAVATFARAIQTAVFPALASAWLREQGLKRWTGPRYLVPTPREEQLGLETERFFRAFELLFRRHEGEAWASAGVLRGPSNNFEARVCDLRGVRAAGAGGIEARFLRFVPIVEGDISARGLRVAVFGAREERTTKQERAQRASSSLDDAAPAPAPAPATVTYALERWRAPGNVHTLSSSRRMTGCRCCICLGDDKSSTGGGRRRATTQPIADYLARELGADAAAWEDYQHDLADAAADADMAAWEDYQHDLLADAAGAGAAAATAATAAAAATATADVS
jgi:hypothetical protein